MFTFKYSIFLITVCLHCEVGVSVLLRHSRKYL